MGETRKLAAILVADVVGYSRLAAADEDRTLARLRGLRSDLIDRAIAAHRGRIVKRTRDGSLTEFRSVVDVVRCAIESIGSSRGWYRRSPIYPGPRTGSCGKRFMWGSGPTSLSRRFGENSRDGVNDQMNRPSTTTAG
jgi:hypothetical protein